MPRTLVDFHDDLTAISKLTDEMLADLLSDHVELRSALVTLREVVRLAGDAVLDEMVEQEEAED